MPGTWPAPRSAIAGKVAMLTSVGTIAMPWAANTAVVSSSSPQACSMQSVPAAAKSRSDSSPKQCAVTRAPSSWAAATASVRAARGQQRGQVAAVAVDPVADELDPAVATARLPADVCRELGRLDLVCVARLVSPRTGQVAAGPDDPRQVFSPIDPPGVRRAPRVADEQRAGVAVGAGLRLGGRLVDRATRVQADVAVRVDEARQHPAAQHLHVGSGTARPGIRDPAVDNPDARARVVRSDEHLPLDPQHRRHARHPSEVAQCAGMRANRRSASIITSGASVCTQWPAPLTVIWRTLGKSAFIAASSWWVT